MTEKHQFPNMKNHPVLKEDFSDEFDGEIVKPLRPYDVVFMVCSRGRADMLTRLVTDINYYLAPAVIASGLSYCVSVYAQDYASDWLTEFDDSFDFPLFVENAGGTIHTTVGNVVQTGVQLLDKQMESKVGHSLFKSKVIVMVDDDSIFVGDARVNSNISRALKEFIDKQHTLYSVRLGSSTTFEMLPLLDASYPVMPGKEKMQWVRPDILMAAITHPRFSDLTIGEDAIVSTVAWTNDPKLCFSLYGIGTFIHLGLEGHLSPVTFELANGLESLPEPDEHFTPQKMLPDIFVPELHPLHAYYGVRPEVIERMKTHGRSTVNFDLG